ncbi:MAG: hypothetical protein V3T72_15620 [Thermoanaerobaculia bacterium]
MDRLDNRRRQAEQRLTNVRAALDREVGWAPRTRVWILPLVAFACGLAVAGAGRRRFSSRDRD